RSVDVNSDADERAWADRIRAGDIDAFEALYRTYWQRLYAFAFRYVQTKEDAEEVTQEVFFRIWRGRAQWMPAGAVRNYLYLAVRNAARDRLERAAVARRWGGRVGQLVTATEIQSDLEAADLVAAVQRAFELGRTPDATQRHNRAAEPRACEARSHGTALPCQVHQQVQLGVAHVVVVAQALVRSVEQPPERRQVAGRHRRFCLPHAGCLGDHVAEPSREHLGESRARQLEQLLDRGCREQV